MSLPLEMLDHDGNSTRVEKSLNLGPIGYLEYSGNCSSAVNEDNPEVCEKFGPDVCEKFGLDVANSSNEPINLKQMSHIQLFNIINGNGECLLSLVSLMTPQMKTTSYQIMKLISIVMYLLKIRELNL